MTQRVLPETSEQIQLRQTAFKNSVTQEAPQVSARTSPSLHSASSSIQASFDERYNSKLNCELGLFSVANELAASTFAADETPSATSESDKTFAAQKAALHSAQQIERNMSIFGQNMDYGLGIGQHPAVIEKLQRQDSAPASTTATADAAADSITLGSTATAASTNFHQLEQSNVQSENQVERVPSVTEDSEIREGAAAKETETSKSKQDQGYKHISSTTHGSMGKINSIYLSGTKRPGFIHPIHQPMHWHEHHDFVFNTNSEDSNTQLEQLVGSWYYDSEEGGFAIDATTAAILGITKYQGYLSSTALELYLLSNDLQRLKRYMNSPEQGDLVFDSVMIAKGENFGKRFIFQGQILSRSSDGQALKAMGTLAYESSPYAEFLTREIANDGLFIWDKSHQAIISNTAFHQLLGYIENMFPTTLHSLMGLIHPDDNDVLSLQGHILSSPQYGDSYECCVRLKRADQRYIWATVRTLVTERNSQGIASKLIGAVTNIDLLQENFDNLKLLMFSDPLTGLHNRTYFHQNQLRYENPLLAPVSMIFLDVSGLKLTNDILGHNYGDFLLLKTSQLLQNALQVTLTYYNADQRIVKSLIAKRTALSTQAEMIGSTLNSNEQIVGEPNTNGARAEYVALNAVSQSLNEMSQNYGQINSTTDGVNELSFQSDIPNVGDTRIFSTTNRTTNTTTISSNYTQHVGLQEKFTRLQSLDCLDRPEGCLLSPEDLNNGSYPTPTSILNLPKDLLCDLESLGVTPVSAENESHNQEVGIKFITKEAAPTTQTTPANNASNATASAASNKQDQPHVNADLRQKDQDSVASNESLGGEFLEENSSVLDEVKETRLFKQGLEYSPEILRLGGDEFIVLFPNCDEAKIYNLYKNILKIRELLIANQEQCPIEQRSVPICFGIGYATVGEKGMRNDNFLQAMQRADYRMQNNKEEHHNEHYKLLQAFFEAKLQRHVSMRDERRLHILSQKERTKLRQRINEYQSKD